MSRAQIKDIRRQELLEAAFEIIKRHGLQAATLSSIAEEAGASKGIVHHYFKNKQQLIEQAMRYAHTSRRNDLLKRFSVAQTASERLWAVISIILDEKYFQPGFCKAWISFFAETFSDDRLARLHRAIQRRESSNLVHALLPFLTRVEARRTAIGIRALVEGYRFRLGAVHPTTFESSVPVSQVLALVRRRVRGFDQSTAIRR
jgi:TetR/AcrR family transcriptional regulator, transcriptional repressor of bet genes